VNDWAEAVDVLAALEYSFSEADGIFNAGAESAFFCEYDLHFPGPVLQRVSITDGILLFVFMIILWNGLSGSRHSFIVIMERFFSLFYSAVVLHGAKRMCKVVCKLCVGHLGDFFCGDTIAIGDDNFTSHGKQFFVFWPAFKGAIDKYRHNSRVCTSAYKSEAGLEGRDLSV
jgi:hypothetical protein